VIIWTLALMLGRLVGIIALIADEEFLTFDQEPTNISPMRIMKLVEVVKTSDKPQSETRDRRYRPPLSPVQKIDFVVGQSVTDDIEESSGLTREIKHPSFNFSPLGFGLQTIAIPLPEDRFDSLMGNNTHQNRVQHQMQSRGPTGIIEHDLGLHRDAMRQWTGDRDYTNTNPRAISGGHRPAGELVGLAGLIRIDAQYNQSDNFENEAGTIEFESKVFEDYLKPALHFTPESTCAIIGVFLFAFGWSLLQFRALLDWSNRLRFVDPIGEDFFNILLGHPSPRKIQSRPDSMPRRGLDSTESVECARVS